jgi:hypothetical protein
MPHEATGTTNIGSRLATQIGNAAATAGEKVDAAIGYAKQRTQAFTDSAHQLVDGSWSGLKGVAAKVPYTHFIIGLGAGFCLGWFARRHSSRS